LFDGHGSETASQWLSEHMIDKLDKLLVDSSTAAMMKFAASAVNAAAPTAAATVVETPEAHSARIRKCIVSCFRDSERELCAWLATRKDEMSGSCALLTLFDGQAVWVAHVGDSRAVLAREKTVTTTMPLSVAAAAAAPPSTGAAPVATVPPSVPWQAVSLTADHSCVLAAERARVESAGGFVDGDGRINGRLAVSRALGDRALKKPCVPHSLVSAVPDIARFVFKNAAASPSASVLPAERALLLASDGVWDVLTPAQAVALVQTELERIAELEQADRAAGRKPLAATPMNGGTANSESPRQFACRRAVECVMRELAQRHVQDNVTVTLVLFDHPIPSPSLPAFGASAAAATAAPPRA
jgi:serine/threonine protein phosphatase PrpC